MSSFLNKIDFSGKKVLYLSDPGNSAPDALDQAGAARLCKKVFDAASGIDSSTGNSILPEDDPVPSLKENECDSGVCDPPLFPYLTPLLEAVSEENAWDIVIILPLNGLPHEPAGRLLDAVSAHSHDRTLLVVDTPVSPAHKQSDAGEEQTVNGYTTLSLKRFLKKFGFEAITEARFYQRRQAEDNELQSIAPFKQRWDAARDRGLALAGSYSPDVLNHALPAPAEYTSFCLYGGINDGLLLSMPVGHYEALNSTGGWDDDFNTHLNRHISGKPKIIFDVGGFIGLSSLSFSRLLPPGGKVVCFEPNPWNVDKICEHFSANPDEAEKFMLYPLALGEKDEEISMYLSDDIRFSSGSQRTDGYGTAASHEDLHTLGFVSTQIKAMMLDTFVERTGLIPDIIKVDIEGSEVMFLKGAARTLARYQPILYMEWHSTKSASLCLELLQSYGYRVELLRMEMQQGMMHVFAEKVRA